MLLDGEVPPVIRSSGRIAMNFEGSKARVLLSIGTEILSRIEAMARELGIESFSFEDVDVYETWNPGWLESYRKVCSESDEMCLAVMLSESGIDIDELFEKGIVVKPPWIARVDRDQNRVIFTRIDLPPLQAFAKMMETIYSLNNLEFENGLYEVEKLSVILDLSAVRRDRTSAIVMYYGTDYPKKHLYMLIVLNPSRRFVAAAGYRIRTIVRDGDAALIGGTLKVYRADIVDRYLVLA